MSRLVDGCPGTTAAAPRASRRPRFGACLFGLTAALAVAPGAGSASERARAQAGSAGGPAMRWPLDRAPVLVSSFGEYRYDHMHAGVDLSTGGATGLKVRAAGDGVIVRLKVEWRGYGRALYLRHPDGRTTVYAHLERYEDAGLGLERIVKRRQADAGTRYPGDIYLNPAIPVHRGQVIAYSGESGAGPPHLHFEVRGPGDQPLDPLRAGLRAPDDRRSPVLESVTIAAADPATYIDGVLRERTYSFETRGAHRRLKEPVRTSGPFLATLSAYDPVPGGRVGLRFLEVRVDGHPFYRLDFDAFRFDQYPISGLVHDHRFSHLGPTRFGYRMSRLPGNALADGPRPDDPGGAADAGSFDLEEGAHRLDIEVRDASSRVSRARLCVLVGRPGALTGARLAAPGDRLPPQAVARFDPLASSAAEATPEGIDAHPPNGDDGACVPSADSVEGELWSEKERRYRPLDCRPRQGICYAGGPISDRGAVPALRLRRVDGGVPGPWQAVPERAPEAADPRRLRVELLPAFIDLLLPIDSDRSLPAPADPACPAPGGPAWRLRDGGRLGGGVRYDRLAGIPADADPDGAGCLLRRGLADVVLEYVRPSVKARLEGAGFTIDMPEGARFHPGALAARTAPAAGLPTGLRPIGAAIDVLPEGEALNARATLSFDLGAEAGDPRRLGIFRFDPVTGRWSFEGDSVEAGSRAISLPFRRHGRFALLRDESPPIVVAVRPRPGAGPFGRSPEIVAEVEEVGKGLGPDGVSFVLDGTALESEFDPDRGTARPLQPPVLGPGLHHLRVVAMDRAGNLSTPAESRFEVR